MNLNSLRSGRQSDIFIALFVLVLLLTYTFALLFAAPYQGFYFNPSNGRVSALYGAGNSDSPLLMGDFIERVDQMSISDYSENRNSHFFRGFQEGQTAKILIRRNNELKTISWTYPGFNRSEFLGRFFNLWWLAYVFWFLGMIAQLQFRPKDTQWRLFVASNYLLALFIMFGSVSSYRVLMSSTLLHVVSWLIFPVYLHFHWIFPQSFRRIPGWLKRIFYAATVAVALAELFHLLPGTLYFLAVAVAFAGSILLLFFHFLLHREHRSELRLLAGAALLTLFPVIVLSVISSAGWIPETGLLSLLVLPVLPCAYFYVLYRRSLGGLELRANRAISLYIFLVILGSVLLVVVASSGSIPIAPEAFVFASIVMALLTTFISIQIFPAFQSFVERRLLGIKLPAQNMVENFSARIVTSTTSNQLLKLLEEEVFPSLLVRQYAFVQIVDGTTKVLLARDVDLAGLSDEALHDLSVSLSTGQWIALSAEELRFGWVRLALPLKVGDVLIGSWLLGRRDPDDHYLQAELPILQSLANQTAIALSYLIQTESLKEMYQANLTRHEQERQRLGHELHDSLLNEMAAMLMKHDLDALPLEFQKSFDGLIVRLREIVSDLRPPMLVYGLKYALGALADNQSERHQDMVQIVSEIEAMDDCRYPEIVEHHIYRIVQEACENALKYARARSIHISGELSLNRIELQVTDDGIGFGDGVSLKLEDMVANKHYGLAGMHERAALIGAVIQIRSQPSQGTQIRILWESKDSM